MFLCVECLLTQAVVDERLYYFGSSTSVTLPEDLSEALCEFGDAVKSHERHECGACKRVTFIAAEVTDVTTAQWAAKYNSTLPPKE